LLYTHVLCWLLSRTMFFSQTSEVGRLPSMHKSSSSRPTGFTVWGCG
jgi:hypothetical protein